jgi:hypothetical protein
MRKRSTSRGRFTLLATALFLALSATGYGQDYVRRDIHIPDVGGYLTLKCDFHQHTVFSDATVWPSLRVQEAWHEGLDAISITDHIEYRPHKGDITAKLDRPYEIALPEARATGVILIKGGEITRQTPPGHHNALFVTELDSLDRKDFYEAVGEAEEQGAFIFYNHPGWVHPQGIAEWFEYQTKLMEKGQLYGVEVVNGNDYYPLAHQWCIEKKLTMLGNSDSHYPMAYIYDSAKGEHRPMTLVFAKKRTAEAIKEALFARRTAVWWKGGLIGDREYLSPIFRQSLAIAGPPVTITGNGGAYLQIRNDSDIRYEIETTGTSEPVSLPKQFVLPAGETVILPIRKTAKEAFGRKIARVPVTVKNLYAEPEKGLVDEIEFTVNFQRPEREASSR